MLTTDLKLDFNKLTEIYHILFNLLDRENDIDIAIPFIGNKATWHINEANNYQPYGSVLWRPKNPGVPIDDNTEWVYTPRVHFFELWNDVEGTRVYVDCPNPDIQTQAFVQGNRLFLALNNLDEQDVVVNLDILQQDLVVSSIDVKRLKIWPHQDPQFIEESFSEPMDNIRLIGGETAILEYSFSGAHTFNNTLRTKKYYTKSHLRAINGPGAPLSFTFDGVDIPASGSGKTSYLRMSIGRAHNKSKKPMIKVNGETVEVPDNWAGYDQANREEFFGMIRVPVPFSYLDKNNRVDITFPDAGGRLSSLILEVNGLEK